MGIFSTAGPFDADVDKVTPEEDKGTEDWGSILDICDKVGKSSSNAKECLKSIIRRLNNPNPHVVLKAVTLLDACVNNCGKVFHLEIASREFEQEYRKLLKRAQPKIADSLKVMLKKWAENEFKSDPQLNLIPTLYMKLRGEGVEFPSTQDNSSKSISNALPKDPNAVTSQQEVDDIAKAIELSLKEVSLSGQSSLYPSTNSISSSSGNKSYFQNSTPKQKHLVKALYDFEAVEDNELTFYTGEIIEVLDDSDKNWWKGVNRRGEGLFPANFVTDDLSSLSSNAEGENKNDHSTKNKNRVRFDDSVSADVANNTCQENIIINEQKIDRLLHLLHEANPTDESADTEEMISLEEEANAMGPLIDAELEKVDRKHAQLTQLSSNLVDALNLYHTLMREPFLGSQHLPESPYGMPMPMHSLPHPHLMHMMYNSGVNGPYSLPPGGRMNEQYPANTMHHGSVQPPGGVHQLSHPPSHHFVPIATVPVQSDGFHHPTMMNPPVSNHSYSQSLDPNVTPMQYSMPPSTLMTTQQMPQNLYQPIQHQVPLQETSSPGTSNLQNSGRI